MVTSPATMNSEKISDSVHAVTAALTAQIIHSNGSRRRASFASFTLLRAMIAMTAAPTP